MTHRPSAWPSVSLQMTAFNIETCYKYVFGSAMALAAMTIVLLRTVLSAWYTAYWVEIKFVLVVLIIFSLILFFVGALLLRNTIAYKLSACLFVVGGSLLIASLLTAIGLFV